MNAPSIASPEPGDLSRITGRVYVASSLSTYRTPRYDRMVASVREQFPHATILPARDQFTSNHDWRRRWPDLLPTLQGVVFFADNDGYVGYGVWTELNDALDRGIPVRYLTPNGGLCEISAEDGEIEVLAFRPWDWRQFAMIAYTVPATEALALLKRERRESRIRRQVAVLQCGAKGGA